MKFKNVPGKGWTPVRLTREQLQNELDASRRRFDGVNEICENLRRSHSEQSNLLAKAYHERDDWRDAFKLIMRLVK